MPMLLEDGWSVYLLHPSAQFEKKKNDTLSILQFDQQIIARTTVESVERYQRNLLARRDGPKLESSERDGAYSSSALASTTLLVLLTALSALLLAIVLGEVVTCSSGPTLACSARDGSCSAGRVCALHQWMALLHRNISHRSQG
eukprot:jgi/Mesvir1/27752/Mv07441-RA.1